jgi:hypothetical protein
MLIIYQTRGSLAFIQLEIVCKLSISIYTLILSALDFANSTSIPKLYINERKHTHATRYSSAPPIKLNLKWMYSVAGLQQESHTTERLLPRGSERVI